MGWDDYVDGEMEFEAYQDNTVWHETVEITLEAENSLPQLDNWF